MGNTYDAANILLASGTNQYTNDWNGNTLAGGGRTNTWDSQNRLVQTMYNGVTSSFTYGSAGLRRSAAAGGVTTHYVLDGQNVVQGHSGGALVGSYLYGPRGPECKMDADGPRSGSC